MQIGVLRLLFREIVPVDAAALDMSSNSAVGNQGQCCASQRVAETTASYC